MSIIEKAVGKLETKKKAETESASAKEPLAQAYTQTKDIDTPDLEVAIQVENQVGAQDATGQPDRSTRLQLAIPYARFREHGLITPDAPRSKIAEEFRRIKRPLLMNIEGEGAAPVKNANLIMVTSALPGEGKTFSSVNLAMSIAMEQDKTVLFVDADVSKASAGSLLGVPKGSKGLIDVLENNIDIADVLYQTDIPNLRVLPAGKVHERSTELLASENMRRLMADMSRRYPDRVIVFDSPPLLPTTEANVLANLMGQIVFVVAGDQTSQGAVTEAISHIEGDKVIGLVLNKSTARFGVSYGYGYTYEYGYGYGYGAERQAGAEGG